MDDRKLAVLFPGIGYHCDKPLLYYSAKVALAAGYRVRPVPYAGFPAKVRGDGDKLRACVEIAWSQACEMLADVSWAAYDDILFVGKSIGTLVASRYACERRLAVKNVLLTPLAETFQYVAGTAIAFHGTADPWADTQAIVAACRERGVPLCLTEGANHSLETGDALRDIQTVGRTVERIVAFIRPPAGPVRSAREGE
jgi:phosphoglycolate phosphatase